MPSGLTTRFSASYDKAAKIISTVVCVALLFVVGAAHSILVTCLVVAILVLTFVYSPREYIISDGSIAVKRFIGDVRIPLEEVREARAVTKDDLRGCIRLWGNGGLFGYYGIFRTRALGICSWYVTNRSRAVVIKTAAKTVLFRPDDKDGFLMALRDVAPG